jgi:hypothetical protein
MKDKFKYYMAFDGIEPTPFYSMPVDTGLSDVSVETLLKNGRGIPYTPSYEFWKKEVGLKRRCGHCWRSLRGPQDLNHHMQNNHLAAFKPKVGLWSI